ncbi:MAG: hypothetical protein JWO08_4763 [Verrucomicrobiaceae bacterium]|nr:hypothetical protein [Verrucomicrobiaceae bacterium]
MRTNAPSHAARHPNSNGYDHHPKIFGWFLNQPLLISARLGLGILVAAKAVSLAVPLLVGETCGKWTEP